MDTHPHEHIFLALCNALPGEAAAFNAWYDQHHVAEVIRYMPGFVAGRRYRRDRLHSAAEVPWEYLALYDLETDDVAAMHLALPDVAQYFTRPKGLDPVHQGWVYSRVGNDGPQIKPSEAANLVFRFADPIAATGVQDAREADSSGAAAIRYRLHADQRAGQDPIWRELLLYPSESLEAARGLLPALPRQDGSSAAGPTPQWRFESIGPRLT